MTRFVKSLALVLALAAFARPAHAQVALISKVGLPRLGPNQQVVMNEGTQAWCLSAAGTRAGSPVVLTSCRPLLAGGLAPAQRFRFTAMGTGPVVHVPTGLCLDARQSDGALLLWSCHGGWNQQFTNTRADQFRLKDGKCIDLPRGEVREGAPIIVYACNGGANQGWMRTNR